MADEAQAAAQPAAAKPAPTLNILAQITRSVKFENPGALQRFEKTPTIAVNINVDASKRGDDEYIVGLRIDSEAKSEETSVYSLSLDYAGVFRVQNVEPRVLEPMLLVECPRLLFPFARRIIADMTRDGGYQPMMLDPVDFVALYRKELERRAADQKQANGGTDGKPATQAS